MRVDLPSALRRPLVRDGAGGLLLLLVLFGLLLPTAGILWFMNEAARSQAANARQSVTEAYRGQLRLVRGRLDAYLDDRLIAIQAEASGGNAATFKRIVTTGLADSVVLLNANGSVAYPSTSTARAAEKPHRTDWLIAEELESTQPKAAASAYAAIVRAERDPALAARAAQSEIRCLVRSGDPEGALLKIQMHFLAGRGARTLDLQGRLIAADELLLALQLLKPGDRRRMDLAERLAALLDDYDGATLPSAQRLFLMTEMHTMLPEAERPAFPTYRAEQLALTFLEATSNRSIEASLQPTGARDLWQLPAAGSRAIALYRTSTMIAAVDSLLDQQAPPSGVRFLLTPPGTPNTEESISAGSRLPGWQLSYAVLSAAPIDQVSRQQNLTYAWIAVLLIAAMAVTGLVVGQSFRSQLRLAQLKTDLVATVSHELKTPLSSMQVLVDSLLDDAQPDQAKTHDYLRLIAKENVRLSRLIENFLTFSRIERNRQRFEFVDTAPADLVSTAVDAMHERLKGSDGQLKIDVSPDLPLVHADRDALVTVFLNLLDNAYKYTPSEKRIRFGAEQNRGHVEFSVTDNGIGISPSEHKRIFRKFYQVDERLARETGGCGLGLSIVDSIVRAHRGTVRVVSQPGAGSTFIVSLPCRPETSGAAA